MKITGFPSALLAAAVSILPALSQQAAAPAPPQAAAFQSTVDEVVLDFVARDRKGKPVTDLKLDDLALTDNGIRQQPAGLRLIQGAEAIGQAGAVTKLDPLRQIRLVTLVFEATGEAAQRKTARSAALDLVKGDQAANVFYSVVAIDTRLLALQPFTADRGALVQAIETATAGYSAARLVPASEKIKADLKDHAAGGADVQAKLASVMLEMLRMDAAMASQDARLSLNAMQSLVGGLQTVPGRKSVLYFSGGMTVTPELDAIFRSLTSMANRANVAFYPVDTRGVMTGYGVNTRDVATGAQNAGAADQLGTANTSAGTTMMRREGGATKDEITASDKAEGSSRANVQLPLRNLAESTGGFLLGDSNDFRAPLRRVHEEIAGYYEVTYDPHIAAYDGSFHKLKLETARKNVVLQSRDGYFALAPEARAAGLQAFEVPLLKAISEAQVSHDVDFLAGPFLLRPGSATTAVSVLVEVPLKGLHAKPDASGKMFDVHISLGALVRDARGETAGPRLTRDRSLHVTAAQLQAGHFVEKLALDLAPGPYSLDTAVVDQQSGKMGIQHSAFTVAPAPRGVGISSLASVRSYTPGVKGLDPNEPFQFEGGAITPTLDHSVPHTENSSLRLFFVVYKDPRIAARPTVEIEFLRDGKSLTKVPMQLPDADAQGRIPYVMTVSAAAIPPGDYEVRASARQGETESAATTEVKIESN